MEINDLLKDKDALKQLIGALQNLVDQTSDDESSIDEGYNDEHGNIMNTKTRKKSIVAIENLAKRTKILLIDLTI